MQYKKPPEAIVHKHRSDDVFICNCRAALPVFFNVDLLQMSNLDSQDLLAIQGCYRDVDTGRETSNNIYLLKNIPWKMQSEQDGFGESSQKTVSWLNAYYLKTDDEYRLRECAIPESIQNEMMAVVSGETLSEYARYRASIVLDKLTGIRSSPNFHCTVYNDTKHYYFYGKRHEHVPGIQLMEIARQAFYAHFYKFNKHTRESVNLSILNFNCEFVSYLQSNYAVLIAVETLSCVIEGASREKHHLRATFTQEGHVACIIEMVGTVVGSKLFNKLRDIKPPTSHAFSPICNENKVIVLLSHIGGDLVEGEITSVSADMLFMRAPNSSNPIECNGDYKFHLFTQHQGAITGNGVLVPSHAGEKRGAMAIRITDWTKGSGAKFREFIKMDCYLIESDYAVA